MIGVRMFGDIPQGFLKNTVDTKPNRWRDILERAGDIRRQFYERVRGREFVANGLHRPAKAAKGQQRGVKLVGHRADALGHLDQSLMNPIGLVARLNMLWSDAALQIPDGNTYGGNLLIESVVQFPGESFSLLFASLDQAGSEVSDFLFPANSVRQLGLKAEVCHLQLLLGVPAVRDVRKSAGESGKSASRELRQSIDRNGSVFSATGTDSGFRRVSPRQRPGPARARRLRDPAILGMQAVRPGIGVRQRVRSGETRVTAG